MGQRIKEPLPLLGYGFSCFFQEFCFPQCGDPGILRHGGHIPRLGSSGHPLQQRPVGAHAVAQPKSRHAVAFGEGLQDQQAGKICQIFFQTAPAVAEIQKALVGKNVDLPLLAQDQDPDRKIRIDAPAGGVIGAAQEQDLGVGGAENIKQTFLCIKIAGGI